MQPLCLLVEVGGGRNPLVSAIFDHWAGFLLAASVDVNSIRIGGQQA